MGYLGALYSHGNWRHAVFGTTCVKEQQQGQSSEAVPVATIGPPTFTAVLSTAMPHTHAPLRTCPRHVQQRRVCGVGPTKGLQLELRFRHVPEACRYNVGPCWFAAVAAFSARPRGVLLQRRPQLWQPNLKRWLHLELRSSARPYGGLLQRRPLLWQHWLHRLLRFRPVPEAGSLHRRAQP